MTRETRPNHFELGFFASLIGAPDNRGQAPVGESDAEFVRHLDYHGITMMALQHGKLPAGVTRILQGRKAMMVANEQLKVQAMIDLFQAFAKAGLDRNILFKGGALAYSAYDQPWLRPRSDIDILICEVQHPDFAQVLFDLGYQKLFAIEGKHVSYQHTYSKQLAGHSVMNIDLHWRINNRQTLAKSYAVDELIAASSTLAQLSNDIKIPHPVDSLLIASLHRLGHHHSEERLTWLFDIHLLAHQLSDRDWLDLLDKANNKKLCGITRDALRFSQRLFATEIPATIMQGLQEGAALKEPSQIYLDRGASEWRYFWADVLALEGVNNKLNLVWENLFPRPDYVRQQMGTKSAAWAYLKRAMRGFARFSR